MSAEAAKKEICSVRRSPPVTSDGDGADDLALGAPGKAPLSDPASGLVYVLYGNSPTLRLTHGPVLGAVSDTGIRIWVRASREARYELAYRPAGGGEEVLASTLLRAENDKTGAVALGDLTPATEYTYRVLLDGSERYTGTFRTLPPAGRPARIRFALGADIHSSYRPFRIFDPLLRASVDFMLSVGDNIYADSPSLVPDLKAAYEGRYRTNWSDESFRTFMQQVPMFLMWDDHEIINNFWPGRTGRYANARAAYDEYQGSVNPEPRHAGEIYYTFEAGEADFYVLDTRSHRSRNDMPDGPGKTLLGAAQREDLLAWLSSSQKKFKFIVSSVPFNDWSTTADDSWNGRGNLHGAFLTERTTILDFIRDQAIPGVVLLSGDQHWSGVFKLSAAEPYPLYEFLPTPLAINNRAAPDDAHPEILFLEDQHRVVGLFDVDTTVSPATLLFRLLDAEGGILYSLELTEDDLGF